MTRKIPNPKTQSNTEIVLKEYFDNASVVFDFQLFQPQSVRLGDFHNFCENRQAALDQVSDLVYTLKMLSQHKRRELDQDKSLRDQFHWSKIHDGLPLSRIDGLLRKKYGFPDDVVDQFDNEYIEFSCSNGQRVICVVHDNVIAPLFLDPNHLICQEGSSRNVSRKMTWNYPSLLCKIIDEKTISEDDEARKMILDGVKDGSYQSLDELREIITDFGL